MGLVSFIIRRTLDVDRMPTEWEQDVAEIYVNERQLVRPDTTVKTALIYVLIFILVTVVFTWLVHYVFLTVGIVSYLPSNMQNFYETHPDLSIVILCGAVVLVEMFFCLKYAIIGAIKLYQRYAPEDIRRRCLFMPTCSEYTIMVVRKYGAVIGFCKAYFRLVYLCRGNIYRIHYP
jgi:putative component of membrane protein insertase Oxa1/YidC/SpoIIIJ protein YidD